MVASTAVEPVTSKATATDAVSLLSTVADPIRWTVLNRLAAGEACVCELQKFAPVPGNLLSYHLRVLREAGLVSVTRRGRWMDYRLAPDAPARLAAALPTVDAVS